MEAVKGFTIGEIIEVQTAGGDWVRRVAASDIERGHKFAVVWVATEDEWRAAQADGGRPECLPWPVDGYTRRTSPAQPPSTEGIEDE
jgi:hypothetical protein